MSIDMTDAHFESIIKFAREIKNPEVRYNSSIGEMKDEVIRKSLDNAEAMLDILREYEY